MHSNIFVEISALLALAAAVAMIMRFLRQPLLISYIVTGLIVGPSVLGLVKSPETIAVLGNFGIALLLFIVGLGLNPRVIKEVGKVSLLVGMGQVVFTSVLGYVLVRSLGYDSTTAIFLGIALAFSSTIIILKLLSDKREQNKLFGKISIGLLLIQDLVATFALLFASASKNGGFSVDELLLLGAKGAALVCGVLLFTRLVIKPLASFFARSQELLFLFAIAWGFGIATLFYELGFSLEVGALFAGVCLASFVYAQEVASRLRPLRDFFVIVFFISLGASINLGDVQSIIWQAIVLSLFVLLVKPLIVTLILGIMGYTKKTSFKTGVVMAQVSEFSIILLLLAVNNGQVSEQAATLVTVVGVITITVSSYLIIYADGIYEKMEKLLPLFERKKVKTEREQHQAYEAILFGYRRGGIEFVHAFERVAKNFAVVDYDPDVIDELESRNVSYIYGDATDLEMLDEINFEHVKSVVSVMSDHDSNIFLLQQLEKRNPSIVAICHADTVKEAVELYGLGASFVVLPHYIGNEKIGAFIRKNGFKKSEFNQYREKHIHYLENHFDMNKELAD